MFRFWVQMNKLENRGCLDVKKLIKTATVTFESVGGHRETDVWKTDPETEKNRCSKFPLTARARLTNVSWQEIIERWRKNN